MALTYTLSRKQFQALEGLAYHIADINYIKERFPQESAEIEKAHKNILLTFSVLDSLAVPYWVQNIVVCFSENWRQYKSIYLDSYLKNKGVSICSI